MSTLERKESFSFGPGVRPGPRGLGIVEGLSFEAWKAIGEKLGRIADTAAWWIGDWLFYGEFEYGAKYREAVAVVGRAEQTLADYAYVCGRFEFSRRRENLSFAHHREVASLVPAEQDVWLDQAEADGWGHKELRDAVQGRRELPAREPTQVTLEQLRITVPPDRAERWKHAAEKAGLAFTDWVSRALDEAAA